MTVFIVFWMAVIGLLFFVTGLVFRAVSSAINALVNTAALIITAGGGAAVLAFLLFFISICIDTVAMDGFKQGFSVILALFATLAILIGVVGFILMIALAFGGGFVLAFFMECLSAVLKVIEIISDAAEMIASFCERRYESNLGKIRIRLEKG